MDNNTLGAELSPSQVSQFLNCSAGYWYKHGLGLPDPPRASLVRGRVVHKTVADWFRRKRDGGDKLADFDETWALESEGAEFLPDEDPAVIKQEAAAMAVHYVMEVGDDIEPAEIEKPVSGTIGGVKVRGIIDLIDSNGQVIDLKTAKRKPSTVAPDHRFQVATYKALVPEASGAARVDTLVGGSRPELVRLTVETAAADHRMVETLYPHVQTGIREGLFFPNRNSNYCSRRYCPFWRECESEFGGQVK